MQNKQGDWDKVTYIENSLIINSGDMLSMCSKNHFPSCYHRVVIPKNEVDERIYLAFCVHHLDDVKLSEKHTGKGYLEERYKELKVK